LNPVERAAGKPQQTFRRLVHYALDGVFSFSKLPLRVLTYGRRNFSPHRYSDAAAFSRTQWTLRSMARDIARM